MKSLKSYAAGIFTACLIFGLIGSVSAKVGKITREVEYRNIKVSLDGKTLDLRNAAGEKVEYDYEIDALSGEIVSYELDDD